MKKIPIILLFIFCFSHCGWAWSRTGHDAIAYIAECNLTPKAKKTIEKYLDGKSIVYYASWMDEYRKTPEYGNTTNWHLTAVDEQFNCAEVMPNGKKTNAAIEVENAIKLLKN